MIGNEAKCSGGVLEDGRVVLFIYLKPEAKQSMRHYIHPNKKYIVKHKDKKVIESEKNIKAQILQQLPEGWQMIYGEVHIEQLVFTFPFLKGFSKRNLELARQGILRKAKKPDLDNLQKNFFDACNNLLWHDDAQITVIKNIEKRYGQNPGIYVLFKEV